MGRKRLHKMSDPVLRAIRRARNERDEAEAKYADMVIAAIEDGYSYGSVAEAALTDKGSLHYYVHRTAVRIKRAKTLAKEQGPGGKLLGMEKRKYVAPAKVDG